MPQPIIGLAGRKRTGKDTAAAVLAEEFGFTRVAFADPLKEAALALDPLVGPCSLPFSPVCKMRRLSEVIEILGWERAKDTVPEVRRTLQYLGTAVRNIDEAFWVRGGLERAEAVGGPVVVTDVRFPNEVEMVRERGGYVIRLTRPGLPTDDAHASEAGIDALDVDEEIVNDGTLFDLANAVCTSAGHYLDLHRQPWADVPLF